MKGAPKKYLLEDYQSGKKTIFEKYYEMRNYVKETFNKMLPEKEDSILFLNEGTGKKIALARVIYHPTQIDK